MVQAWSWLSIGRGDSTPETGHCMPSEGPRGPFSFYSLSRWLAQATHRANLTEQRISWRILDSSLQKRNSIAKPGWWNVYLFEPPRFPYTIWVMTANNAGPAFVAFIRLAVLGRLLLLNPQKRQKTHLNLWCGQQGFVLAEWTLFLIAGKRN